MTKWSIRTGVNQQEPTSTTTDCTSMRDGWMLCGQEIFTLFFSVRFQLLWMSPGGRDFEISIRPVPVPLDGGWTENTFSFWFHFFCS
jgi:hypothetical protein